MDLDYDLSCSFHTPMTLRRKYQALAALGFKSINIVVPPPDNVDYTHAGRVSFLPLKNNNHLADSRSLFGDPFRQAAAYAKQAGLKVYGIFKPYEGGGVYTVPNGHHLLPARSQVSCLGGETQVASFIAKHPRWRLKRRDSGKDDFSLPATSIELAFLLDKLPLAKSDGRTYPALSDQSVLRAPQWGVEIFVSDDNGRYRPLALKPVITREIKRIRIADANGSTLLPSARCLMVTLSGFSIINKYMAVRFQGNGPRLLLVPQTMITVKSGERVLKTTASPTLRYNPSLTREFKRNLPKSADFKTCGFEYAWSWPGGYGWWEWNLIGIARGYEPYIRGALCEAVPAVRSYWLDYLKYIIDCGCDGVDIRLPSHCSGIRDFFNYGFNREILDAFKRRFGRLPGHGRKDFMEIMRIRGSFFLEFLKYARKMLHERGRTFQVHLRECLCKPSLGLRYHENGAWFMPKILPDWKKIVKMSDRVILSDNLSERHFAGARKNVALSIKRYAAKYGKKVWVYCYLQQGHSFNKRVLNDFAADQHVGGIYLYEVVYNKREDDGILEVVNPSRVRVVQKHMALFKELLKP
jgi:hypothetical protein